METRIMKNIFINNERSIGTSKPQKYANLNQCKYTSTYPTIKQKEKSCTYVGLYGSGV